MIIVAISIIFASLLLLLSKYISKSKKNTDSLDDENTELDIFYSLENEPSLVQIRQLLKAARANMDANVSVESQLGPVKELYRDGLVSEKNYNNLLQKLEDISVEKILIENEAEMLRPGFKDTIFTEAAKLPSQGKNYKKKKFFDETLFLKKRDIFISSFKKENVQSK